MGNRDNDQLRAGDADPLRAGDATRSEIKESDTKTLQLFAEDLSVAKEVLETGRVRVSTRTREIEALVDENLARERVEIERVPMGRQIHAAPEVRQVGDTTIVPVVEEVLVVERRLMLKEEIHIRRVRRTERHQETVKLRRQEAVIDRTEGAPDQTNTMSRNEITPTNIKE
jgi:uncharacterized protein (TIGR02271 family)